MKLFCFLPLILASICFPVKAEGSVPNKIDSLKRIIASNPHDTTLINTYIHLGFQYETINFDTSLIVYNQALELSEKNHLQKKKAKTLSNIGFAYLYGVGSEMSIEYLLKALDVYQQIDDKKGVLDSYYNLGFFSGSFERFDSAIEYYKKAIPVGIELNDKKRLAMVYNNIGLMYQYIGIFDKAIEYQVLAAQLKEEVKDETLGYSLLNIGVNYNALNNSTMAIEYLNKAKEQLGANNLGGNASYYNGMGLAYENMGELNDALSYYKKAFDLFIIQHDQNGIARYYFKIGNVYMLQKEYSKSEEAFSKSLKEYPETGSKRLLASIYEGTAFLELKLAGIYPKEQNNHYKNAIDYATKVNDIGNELKSISHINTSAEILYIAHAAIGNSKEALQYVGVYIETKDSIFNQQKVKDIHEIQAKYDTETKTLEIESQKKELSLQNVAIKQERKIKNIFIGGFIVVLLLLLFIYRIYTQKQKANRLLTLQKEKIKKKDQEKEILLKEIHHRVKNNLQIISSLLNLQTKGIEDETALSAMSDGQSRVKAMSLIHQKLYQNKDASCVSFQEYVQQLVAQIASVNSGVSKVNYNIVSDEISLDIDTAIPLGLILNELVTNSFKYAFSDQKEGVFEIKLEKTTQNNYNLVVSDNGKGLPSDYDVKTAKTLGLRLVRRLCKQLYGSIDYEYNDGAVFTITFCDFEGRKAVE